MSAYDYVQQQPPGQIIYYMGVMVIMQEGAWVVELPLATLFFKIPLQNFITCTFLACISKTLTLSTLRSRVASGDKYAL